jgi:hypothetical protein
VCRLNLWRMELFKYMKVCRAAVAHIARCRHHTVATRHPQAHLGTSLTQGQPLSRQAGADIRAPGTPPPDYYQIQGFKTRTVGSKSG